MPDIFRLVADTASAFAVERVQTHHQRRTAAEERRFRHPRPHRQTPPAPGRQTPAAVPNRDGVVRRRGINVTPPTCTWLWTVCWCFCFVCLLKQCQRKGTSFLAPLTNIFRSLFLQYFLSVCDSDASADRQRSRGWSVHLHRIPRTLSKVTFFAVLAMESNFPNLLFHHLKPVSSCSFAPVFMQARIDNKLCLFKQILVDDEMQLRCK